LFLVARKILCLRFLTRFLMVFQSMSDQSWSCLFAPMSWVTLSFTMDSVPLLWCSAEDRLEFSRLSTWVLPYLCHYSKAFAFSRFLYPPSRHPSLRSGFSASREPVGLTMFCRYDRTDQFRFHLYSGGIVVTMLLNTWLQKPTRMPFGFGVSAYFTDLAMTKLVVICLR